MTHERCEHPGRTHRVGDRREPGHRTGHRPWTRHSRVRRGHHRPHGARRRSHCVEPDTGAPLPGSLDSTASAIEACGRRAVPIRLDLLDLDALAPAVDSAIAGLGHLDVLVNNAIYVGPGGHRRFLETEPDELARRVFGNITAQLLLTQRVVAHMVGRGGGLVLDISSAAGQLTPRHPVGEGGWPLSYAVTKAGFHRIADMLALECGDAGVRAFNLNPGFVGTERVRASRAGLRGRQGPHPR